MTKLYDKWSTGKVFGYKTLTEKALNFTCGWWFEKRWVNENLTRKLESYRGMYDQVKKNYDGLAKDLHSRVVEVEYLKSLIPDSKIEKEFPSTIEIGNWVDGNNVREISGISKSVLQLSDEEIERQTQDYVKDYYDFK